MEYQYEDLVTERKLFGQDNLVLPFIHRADFSLIYRGRFDPVYIVHDKYDRLYYDRQTKSFAIPENDIREINSDVDFGQVFGHKLSMRLGKQQIVWGESDLFRSIDIVNPLRIDQNGFVGEAFEDFRTEDRGSPHTAEDRVEVASDLASELRFLPKATPELNAMAQWWRRGKGYTVATRATQSIDTSADSVCRYILELPLHDRLRQAGVLSDNFWLTN